MYSPFISSVQLENSTLIHGKISPPNVIPHEHTAPMAMRMPHLPITATTKTAEMGPDSPSSPTGSQVSPVAEASPPSHSTANSEPQPIGDSPNQPGEFYNSLTHTIMCK